MVELDGTGYCALVIFNLGCTGYQQINFLINKNCDNVFLLEYNKKYDLKINNLKLKLFLEKGREALLHI